MQTKIKQVRAALVQCDAWYAMHGENIRLLSERTEELWFNVDDLVSTMQAAVDNDDNVTAERSLQALLRCTLAIQREVAFVRHSTL